MRSHSLVCALAVDHEENGREQDAWLREWLGASEGDYYELKGAKRKKPTPEDRKEEAAKNGRLSQAAARRGEWKPFGGDPSGAGQLCASAHVPPLRQSSSIPPLTHANLTRLHAIALCPERPSASPSTC